jgi:hypothetical protein
MKNIHLLPTEKPSRLFKFANQLHLDTIPKDYYKKYNIYITSDEFIEEGDFGLNLSTKNIVQYDGIKGLDSYYKKIILTTDQDLIADGVQAIDDEFLEWFVNNPSCEFVVVNFNYKKFRWSELNKSQCYKIIIPQEEANKTHYLDELPNMDKDVVLKMYNAAIPKLEPKQETLEEASSRLLYSKYPFHPPQDSGYWKDMFLEGAKWQSERMYSEEEVKNIVEEARWQVPATGNPREFTKNFDKWFEQFKKK